MCSCYSLHFPIYYISSTFMTCRRWSIFPHLSQVKLSTFYTRNWKQTPEFLFNLLWMLMAPKGCILILLLDENVNTKNLNEIFVYVPERIIICDFKDSLVFSLEPSSKHTLHFSSTIGKAVWLAKILRVFVSSMTFMLWYVWGKHFNLVKAAGRV